MEETLLTPEDIRRFNFNDKGLYRIGIINDGSSILHCIAHSIFEPYYYMRLSSSQILDRRQYVRDLRIELQRVDSLNDELREMLDSYQHLDIRFFDILTKLFKVNIYIIRNNITVNYSQDENNRSIIVYDWGTHFELIGKRDSSSMKTLFSNDHELIIYLSKT